MMSGSGPTVTFEHYLLIALPEIVMAVGAMALLISGVYRGDKATRSVAFGAAALMLITAGLVVWIEGERLIAFSGTFVVDAFSDFAKILILVASSFSVLISLRFLHLERLQRFEYPVLVVLATLGMMMMVSANDLISLYVGLELQSLALYVLAAFDRDNTRSTEAGLKYFVLGALSSGLLLYGASLIYGFSGTTGFEGIAAAVGSAPSIGLLIGLVFLAAGLAFKISAVPFHMWTPDVYEGSPTPITAFFAAAPKLAAMALFVRVLMGPFADNAADWRQIIVFMSAASMILGAFAAIGQTNIKRLMAYSSIGHVGFALVGLAAGSASGVEAVLIYMAIYLAMTLGTFVAILAMRRKEGMVEDIRELSGLVQTQPALAIALGALIVSLAGVPPFAGFFGKLYVGIAAVEAGLTPLVVIAVLSSVVSLVYYLRIIKIMFIDAPKGAFAREGMSPEMWAVLSASAAFTMLFFVYPSPLIAWAQHAAASFF